MKRYWIVNLCPNPFLFQVRFEFVASLWPDDVLVECVTVPREYLRYGNLRGQTSFPEASVIKSSVILPARNLAFQMFQLYE